MGKHFVLIHGAWHGGWCWEGVIQELEKQGHTAEAPTMPGQDLGDDRSGIKFDDLPEIDIVVISHNHYDHLDEGTLLELARRQENRGDLTGAAVSWRRATSSRVRSTGN